MAAILSDALPDPPEMIAPGVTHAAARRRGLAGDEADHRLPDVCFDVGGRGLFRRAADLADHDDGVRVGIFVEQLERVDERRSDDRIAADADTGRLADAEAGQLTDRFIRQRARARHDAHVALLVNVRRA